MKPFICKSLFVAIAAVLATLSTVSVQSADQALLQILLQNGVITQDQYDQLIDKDTLTTEDILAENTTPSVAPSEVEFSAPVDEAELETRIALDDDVAAAIDRAVIDAIASESTIKASYGSKGFRFETRDGNFQTNLQWRAQFRYCLLYTSPSPRDLSTSRMPSSA